MTDPDLAKMQWRQDWVDCFSQKTPAKIYAEHRPFYPQCLHDEIFSYCEQVHSGFAVALDVGCGSGQSILPLVAKFGRVIGVDSSQELLSFAREKCPSAELHLGSAEDLSFVASESVSLVTCASSFHWFTGQDQFLKEANRVLAPNGVLAIFSMLPYFRISDKEIWDFLYDRFFIAIYGEKEYSRTRYPDLVLPWNNTVRLPTISVSSSYTVDEYTGLLESLSAWWNIRPEEDWRTGLLAEFRDRVKTSCKNKEKPEVLDVTNRYVLILGHKTAES